MRTTLLLAEDDPDESSNPSLILLDLKIPKNSRCRALEEIIDDPGLRRILGVVLTASKAEENIARTSQVLTPL